MTTTPKRRWFRFGLRTLFVVMALVAASIAYHVNWIHQRHAIINREREELAAHGAVYNSVHDTPQAPGILWLFGERGRATVVIVTDARSMGKLSPDDWKRLENAKDLFPEANVGIKHFKVDDDDESYWFGIGLGN